MVRQVQLPGRTWAECAKDKATIKCGDRETVLQTAAAVRMIVCHLYILLGSQRTCLGGLNCTKRSYSSAASRPGTQNLNRIMAVAGRSSTTKSHHFMSARIKSGLCANTSSVRGCHIVLRCITWLLVAYCSQAIFAAKHT